MLRKWTPQFVVVKNKEQSLTLQITRALIRDIENGRLAPGDPLPGSRAMAVSLGVNRKTIAKVYDQLLAEGWLQSDQRRGTFVSSDLPTQILKSTNSETLTRIVKTPGSAIPHRPLLWPRVNGIRFDDGLPDQALMPTTALARSFSSAVRSVARKKLFHYSHPEGTIELRESVSKMLNMRRGMSTTPENICITRGSQMALHTLSQCLLSPGDVVVLEHLTYPPAVQTFQACGAKTIRIGHVNGGIDLDELERACLEHPVKVIYITPHHQFPMTIMLRAEHRLRLRMLAKRYRFIIFEDDYDHEFHFESKPMFPMASSDPGGQVVYIGSFSKILAPNLRVGYISASRNLIEFITRSVSIVDRQGNPVTELAIVEIIENGQLHRHIRKSHAIYKKRRDHFFEMTQSMMSPWCNVNLPAGGLAFWLSFLEPANRLKHERLREASKIQYLTSGECASLETKTDIGIRLGFASMKEKDVEPAVTAVKRVFEVLF